MAIENPRVKVPATAKAGEIVEVKTLVKHDMETGRRKDDAGNLVPKNIIQRFQVDFNGKEVFSVDMSTGIAANPFFAFPFKAVESGTFTFTWIEDSGDKKVETAEMKVG